MSSAINFWGLYADALLKDVPAPSKLGVLYLLVAVATKYKLKSMSAILNFIADICPCAAVTMLTNKQHFNVVKGHMEKREIWVPQSLLDDKDLMQGFPISVSQTVFDSFVVKAPWIRSYLEAPMSQIEHDASCASKRQIEHNASRASKRTKLQI